MRKFFQVWIPILFVAFATVAASAQSFRGSARRARLDTHFMQPRASIAAKPEPHPAAITMNPCTTGQQRLAL